MKLKAGQVVLLSAGEYSNYHVGAIARVKADCDIEQLTREYLNMNPSQEEYYELEESQYQAWLLRPDGPFEEIKFTECRYSDYKTALYVCKCNKPKPGYIPSYNACELHR